MDESDLAEPMRAQLKQLTSDTAIYGLSTMAGRFINYLLVPLYIYQLSRAENGVIGIVYAAFVFFNVIYTYGLESSYLKFASGAGRARAADTFSTAFWSLALSSAVLSLLLIGLARPAARLIELPGEYTYLACYMAAILALDTLSAVPMAELRLARRAWTFAWIRLGNVALNVALNLILLLVLRWRVEAVLISNAAASAVQLLLALWCTRPLLRRAFDGDLLRSMLRFGLPYVPTGLGYAITESVDRMFLQVVPQAATERLYGPGMTTLDMVGVYSNCYKLGVFMLLFVQMFRFAWQPFFLQIQDEPGAPRVFARAFTLFTAAGALVFLGVSFYLDIIAGVIFGANYAKYASGMFIVPIILLAYLAQGWYTHFTAGIFIRGRTRDLPWITLIGAVITLAVNYFLTPRYAMAASAWATLVSYVAMAIALGRVSQRVYPVPYEWGKLACAAIITGAAFLAHAYVLPRGYGIATVLILAVVVSFIALGLLPGPRRTMQE